MACTITRTHHLRFTYLLKVASSCSGKCMPRYLRKAAQVKKVRVKRRTIFVNHRVRSIGGLSSSRLSIGLSISSGFPGLSCFRLTINGRFANCRLAHCRHLNRLRLRLWCIGCGFTLSGRHFTGLVVLWCTRGDKGYS